MKTRASLLSPFTRHRFLVPVALVATGVAQAAEWNVDGNGAWNVDANWVNPGTFPTGAGSVADFSKLNITANRTISLGQNIVVGAMTLGDLSGAESYIFTGTAGQTLQFNQTGGANLTLLANNATFFTNVATPTMGSGLTVSNEGSGLLLFRGAGFTFNNNTLTNSGTGSGAVEFLSNVTAYNFNLGTGTGTKIIQNSNTSELRLTHGPFGWNNGQANQGVVEVQRGTFRYGANRVDILGDATQPMTIRLGNGGNDAASYVVAATSGGIFYQPFQLVSGGSGVLTIAADTAAGTLAYTFQGGVTGNNSLTIENRAGNENLSFTTNALNFSGILTHTGAGTGTLTIGADIGANVTGLVQNSASSQLTLNNAKTFSGPTTIQAGTLALGATGSIANSSIIDVKSGATFNVSAVTAGFALGATQTLGGSGTVVGGVTLNNAGSTLAPGASPGILSFTDSQSWTSFSYDWELNDWAAAVAGTNYDQIAITGGLTLDVAGAYNLNLLSLAGLANTTGDVANFGETANSWNILTTTTGISGFDATKWTIDSTGFTSSPAWAGSWAVSQNGNDLVLTYTPVPEPAAALLGGLGSLLLLRRRRI